MVAFLLVSGQLSAYPLFCTMPGMEMHGMGSMSSADGTDLMSSQNMGDLAGESASDNLNAMSNCEQVCGYCLSYSQPGAKISNLFRNVATSHQADFYSRFAPTEPPKSLFRPPISV